MIPFIQMGALNRNGQALGDKLEVKTRVVPSNAITKGATSTAAAILRPELLSSVRKTKRTRKYSGCPAKENCHDESHASQCTTVLCCLFYGEKLRFCFSGSSPGRAILGSQCTWGHHTRSVAALPPYIAQPNLPIAQNSSI